MPRITHPQREGFISLGDAIEHFARDLLGPHHPHTAATIHKVKSGFPRHHLTSTSREFVIGAMVQLMRHTVRALIRRDTVNTARLSPLVRSLIRSEGDRVLVERYLRKAREELVHRR